MKKIIPEIIFIVLISSIIGLGYNTFSEHSLPLIPKSLDELAVPDSAIFDNQNPNQNYLEKIVSYNQIVKLVGKPDVIFIDARRPEDFNRGHIDNAINIFPLMDDENEYFIKLNELPRNKILIVYCDGGTCDLSEHVAKDLFGFGYNQGFLFKGGWDEWQKRKAKDLK